MIETAELTPGLQCCLRCGRIITDRALHDSIEEPALAAIRDEHPEWAATATGTCQPCVGEYRKLLIDRQTRAGRAERTARTGDERPKGWLSALALRVFGKVQNRSYDLAVSQSAEQG